MTTPPDMLARTGRAVYGAEWQAPLARLLGVSRETIRRWLNGSQPLTVHHPIFGELRSALPAFAEGERRRAVAEAAAAHRRAALVEEAERDLARWLEGGSQ